MWVALGMGLQHGLASEVIVFYLNYSATAPWHHIKDGGKQIFSEKIISMILSIF